MSRMSRLAIEISEMELLDPHNEFGALDFDNHDPSMADDDDWWRMQDAEMTRDELDALEIQAEIQELRTQGYM